MRRLCASALVVIGVTSLLAAGTQEATRGRGSNGGAGGGERRPWTAGSPMQRPSALFGAMAPGHCNTHRVGAGLESTYGCGGRGGVNYTTRGGQGLTPLQSDGTPATAFNDPVVVFQWRERARYALRHSVQQYLGRAYPADELRPLRCEGRKWNARERGTLDDSLGGFSLTLLDGLDALLQTGDLPAFRCAVSLAVHDVAFTNDVFVSVFETSIRVVGGLLSAHLLATEPHVEALLWGARPSAGYPAGMSPAPGACGAACPLQPGACLQSYDGQLLSMARELAERLMPAFDTPSGLPYHRINLATGGVDPTSRETCTAAAGTYLLEWGTLSLLTGDPLYGAVARRATSALWGRRGPSGLVGSSLDAVEGAWRAPHTGVGAGVDSFVEYLAKVRGRER